MNKIQEEILNEFNKMCIVNEDKMCKYWRPEYFDYSKEDKLAPIDKFFPELIKSFLLQSLQKVEDSVREDIACKVEKIRFGFEPPYEGSEDKVMERYWKIQVETLNEVLDVISKK